MEKYIINNVEYTFEEISSAANENGVDIDTYINGMGGRVVKDAVEEPVEKPEAVVGGTVPAAAGTVDTDLQLENGSLESKSQLKKRDFVSNNLGNLIFGYDEKEVNAQGEEFTYDLEEVIDDTGVKGGQKATWNNATDADIVDQPWYKVINHHKDFADKTLSGGLIDLYFRRKDIKENQRRAALGEGDLFEDNVLQFARQNGINNLDVAREKFQRQYDVDSGNAIEVDVELDSDPGKFKLTEKDYDEAGKLKADLTVAESINNSKKNILVDLEKMIPDAGQALVGTVSKYLGSSVVPKSVTEDLAVYATELEKERLFNPSFSLIEALEGKRDKDGKLVAGASVVGAGLNLATTMIPAALTKGRSLAPQIALPMISEYNKAQAEAKGMDITEYYEKGNVDISTPLMYSLPAIGLEKLGYKGITSAIISAAGKNKAAATTAKALSSMGTEAWTEWLQTGIESFNSAKGSDATDEEAATVAAQTLFSEEGLESALQGAVGSGVTIGVGGVGRKTLKALRASRAGVDVEGIEEDVNLIESLRVKKAEATDKDVIDGIEQQIQETKERLKYRVTKSNGLIDSLGENEIDEIASMSDLAALQQKRVLEIKNKLDANEITEDEYSSAYEGFKSSYVKAKNRIKGIVEEAEQRAPEDVAERTVKNADAINKAFNGETMQRVNEETGKKELTDKGLDFFHNTVVPNMNDLVTSIGNRMFRENPEFGEKGYTKREFINDLKYSSEDVRNKASSLIGLVTSFNPEKEQFLTTYITRNLENRSKRILEERVTGQATTGGTSIDTQEARELEADDIVVPATKGPKFVKRLNLSDELMNKARKAAVKALSTAGKVDSRTFTTDIVNSINNEIFEDIRNLVPKPKEREAFMEQFAGAVWDAIPQSSLAKATRNQTFQEWNLDAPTKEAFVDYFLGRDQEGLKASTINDRVKKQLPQYLAKAIGAEYASDLLQNDAEVRERFALTQKEDVEKIAADIEAVAIEEVTTISEKDLKLKAGNDFLSRIFANYKDSEFVNNLRNKAHLLRQTVNKVKVLNKQKADNIAEASIAIAKSFPSELHNLFQNGYTEIVGFHYRYLDPAKSIKKEKVVLDENGEQITLSPGEAGSYYSSLQDILQNQKSLKQLFEDGDISETLYNKFKDINFEKIQIQNIEKGLKKGEFLFELKKILAKDISAKEKQAEVVKIYDPEVFENNKKLAEAIVLSMQELYNNGTIDQTQLASILQYQTDLATGFRGLTGFLGVELKDGPQEIKKLKGEHLKPNAITMNEVFDTIVGNKSVDGLFNNHDQVFGNKDTIMDPADAALGRTSGVEGKLRITKTTSKEVSKSVFIPSENTNLYDLTVKEWVKTFKDSPDLAAAKVDVELEKRSDNIETLIDRAIGKLEDYLGPKGALQANFAAVPINILIGGLRATKLAYRGSKNLAKALEAGYKKVQDYMSQQEWLDFAKQAVTEVKKEPTGATVALAIANENAIKNEQNRINKLNVLNEAKAKKIRVFDFDDTIARSNSKVLYTMPDGTTGKLNATEFAARGEELKNQGAEYDFSEFSKVVEGKPGPLFSVAQRISKARGNEDLYILTARPADSKFAIKEFLDALGLNFKLDNIIGLGDSTAKAKADWMLQKAEKDGFNDFYFADDAIKNVKAVKEALKSIDGKVKVQQAKLTEDNKNKSSQQINEELKKLDEQKRKEKQGEGLERNFRRILNIQKKKGKRPSKWFIPSNAEDVKGLLYAFLPDGAEGVLAKKFFNSAILKPYSDAIAAAEAEILQLSKKFVELKEKVKVNFDENIEGTPYTMSDAIKVYNWTKAGVEVDVLKQEYLDRMIGAVEANAEAKYLAEEIAAGYDIEYNKNWRGVPLNKSIYDAINKGTRTKHLETFSQNVDAIFNKDNLQEIENVFGKSYVQALQNSLKRMQSGRNRVSTDAQSNKFLNWINKSVATTMFFNSRSAVLQLLSSLNFIGQKDNNLFQATAALANQEQWQQDYNALWNSDYLSNRREGAKFDVLADEIAEDQGSFLNKLLQKGFLPTRYADSFAIALGGAAFYRNRANALMKDGMSKEEAEAQALKDWQASAEETQQSSDPSKISEIQASSIGKIIYAFANTPFQYARKSKRLLQDVASGRSKSEGGMNQVRKDLQSVFYYTVGQAMLFNALQSALFASMFSDDEEDKLEEKTITSIERALTSYAKSLGNPGAVVGSVYSVLAEANEQIEKRGRIDNAYKLALEATAISPPLNTKLKDIVAIGNIYKYNHKQIEKDPFEVKLDNPVLEIAGNAASFAGYPLDRVIRKAQNLEAVMNEETAAWEKVFLTLGWSKWELGVDTGSKKKKKSKFKKAFDKKEFDSAFNRLERGVAGKAHNDGSIEVDPNLSPVEREKTIAHEKKHVEDMKAGKLNYDDNYVYWNGKKYERKNGKIKYNGKWYEEGHKSLPWEKRAYDAEPTTKEIKKRKKLY